jgi:rhodanese-related sulfurtransferase
MLGALARLFRPKPPEPIWLEVAALRQRLANAAPLLVVDVRGPDEFDGPLGHIDGAVNAPLPELPAHQPEIIAADRPVVCVCLTDKRSAAAAALLMAAGLGDVTVLRGGMKAWREAGL